MVVCDVSGRVSCAMQALTVAAAPASIGRIAIDDCDIKTKHSDSDGPHNKPLVASGSPSSVLGSVLFDNVLQHDSNEVSVAQVCCYACFVVAIFDRSTSGVGYLHPL